MLSRQPRILSPVKQFCFNGVFNSLYYSIGLATVTHNALREISTDAQSGVTQQCISCHNVENIHPQLIETHKSTTSFPPLSRLYDQMSTLLTVVQSRLVKHPAFAGLPSSPPQSSVCCSRRPAPRRRLLMATEGLNNANENGPEFVDVENPEADIV